MFAEKEESSSMLSSDTSPTDTDSDSEVVEGCGSPRMQRKRRLRKRRKRQQAGNSRRDSNVVGERNAEDMLYDDNGLEAGSKVQVYD